MLMQPRFPGDYTNLELKINDAFTVYESQVDRLVDEMVTDEAFSGHSDQEKRIFLYHLINFLGIVNTISDNNQDFGHISTEYAKLKIDIEPILNGFNFEVSTLPGEGVGGQSIEKDLVIGPDVYTENNIKLQQVDIHLLLAQEDRCFCLWKEDYVVTPGFEDRVLANSQDIPIVTEQKEFIKV